MYAAGPKNPLHGITLEQMVTQLQAHYGWEMLGRMIKINCFNWQPSVKSSLVFLRKTPWARQKVEELYVDSMPDFNRKDGESEGEDGDVAEGTLAVTETEAVPEDQVEAETGAGAGVEKDDQAADAEQASSSREA